MKRRLTIFYLLTVIGCVLLSGRVSAETTNNEAIVYATNDGQQVRLINPDGSNDRAVWNIPQPEFYALFDVALSPDGTSIAISSPHEDACSLLRSDVFTMDTSGNNLRRLTSPPTCADSDHLPRGSVRVTFENQLSDVSTFVIYVEGARNRETVTVLPGSTKTWTFHDVADYGPGYRHRIVAVSDTTDAWLDPLVSADVIPGQTSTANALYRISNSTAALNFFAFGLDWRPTTNTIGYSLGGDLKTIGPNAPIGSIGDSLNLIDVTYTWAWSDDGKWVAYVDNSTDSIYIWEPGSSTPPRKIVNNTDLTANIKGLDWVPGENKVIFAYEDYISYENLYAVSWDENDETLVNLTQFDGSAPDGQYANYPSVSPDGQSIVFQYRTWPTGTAELWTIKMDGSQMQSLGVQGVRPDWGGGQPSAPTAVMFSAATATPTQPIATLLFTLLILVWSATSLVAQKKRPNWSRS